MAFNLTVNTTNGTNSTGAPAMGTSPGQILAIKIALIVIAVTALVGNGAVVYLISMRRRLRTKTNFMVISLAISDLLVAITIVPSFLVCMYVKCDNNLSKLFYDSFLFISVCNLCCITFDRFLAVTRPLRYHAKLTRQKVLVMVIVSWIVPSIVSLVPVTWQYTDASPDNVALNNKIFYTLQVVVFMFFPCVIMLVAYAVIFNIAWKQTKHIRMLLKSVSRTNGVAASAVPTTTTREAKATLKVFGTVVVMFVLCWSLSAFRTIVGNYQLITSLPMDLIMTSRLLLVANSAINPIIYAFWKKDVKMEIRKLLRFNKVRSRSSSTFRSSQADIRGDTITRDYMRTGDASTSKQVALAQVKITNKPPNGIVNEAAFEEDVGEHVESDVNEETKDEEKDEETKMEEAKEETKVEEAKEETKVKEKDEQTKVEETKVEEKVEEKDKEKDEAKEEAKELSPSTSDFGRINLVCEIDGSV